MHVTRTFTRVFCSPLQERCEDVHAERPRELRASLQLWLLLLATAVAHTAWTQQGRCCCCCCFVPRERPDMMQSACMLHNIFFHAHALIASAACACVQLLTILAVLSVLAAERCRCAHGQFYRKMAAAEKTVANRLAQLVEVQLELLKCPVCLDLYDDPLFLSGCAHTFCRDCITKHLRGSKPPYYSKCPKCKKPATKRDCLPNYSLASVVQAVKRALEA